MAAPFTDEEIGMNDTEVHSLIFGLILASLMWGFGVILPIANSHEPHKAIIKQGCGQYNPKSGDFEWLKDQQ